MACVLLGYVGGSVPKKGEGKKPFSFSRTQKICLFLFLEKTENLSFVEKQDNFPKEKKTSLFLF